MAKEWGHLGSGDSLHTVVDGSDKIPAVKADGRVGHHLISALLGGVGLIVTALLPHRLTAAATGNVSLFDPPADDAAGTPMRIVASKHDWTNGPGGETNYVDNVMSWGHNIKAPTAQDVAGKHGVCTTIESKYYGGRGVGTFAFQWEWQVRGIRPDGTQFRPLEIDAEVNGNTVGASWRVGILWAGPETTGNDLTTPVVWAVRPGAYTALTDGVCKVVMPTAHASGARAFEAAFEAATNKTQSVFIGFGNTNWNTVGQLTNQGSGTTQFSLGVNGASAAFFHFFKVAGQEWVFGKNSADNMELAAASAPGSNVALTVDKTSRQTSFNVPPKVPSYTVAGLPSASTYPAGSLVYVSDAAGGPTLACSNGSAWKVLAALGATVA